MCVCGCVFNLIHISPFDVNIDDDACAVYV